LEEKEVTIKESDLAGKITTRHVSEKGGTGFLLKKENGGNTLIGPKGKVEKKTDSREKGKKF